MAKAMLDNFRYSAHDQRGLSRTGGQSHQERFRGGDAMKYEAWVAKAAKQPMVLETVDFG